MRQSRFTEERIIAVLREHEAGSKTGDVCRKYGISSATFYKWKAKYGGLDVSEARRLKGLTDENAKLKKLLAEAMLDNAMLKDKGSNDIAASTEPALVAGLRQRHADRQPQVPHAGCRRRLHPGRPCPGVRHLSLR